MAYVGRGDATLPADPELVSVVSEAAGDRVVLAQEPLVESLAVAGVRVWLSDPIDAFRGPDQKAYLDFLDGVRGGDVALAQADVVVAARGTASAAMVEASGQFVVDRSVGSWSVYLRRGA